MVTSSLSEMARLLRLVAVSILLITCSRGMLLAQGRPTFSFATYPTGRSPLVIQIVDINHDGIPDLVTANWAYNTISVLLGNGNGTFQLPTVLSVPGSPESVAVGDFNGDGELDLVAPLSTNGCILLNNGDGTFQNPLTYPTGSIPSSIAAGDFDGDGKLDIAVANFGSNSVSILRGNGDGTFQAQVMFPVATEPTSVVAADLNHDGRLDLAVSTLSSDAGNDYAGAVSVLISVGDGSFLPRVDYRADFWTTQVVVRDLNHDGHPDLAAVNECGIYPNCIAGGAAPGTVSIFLGNGDGTYAPQVTYIAGARPMSIAATDFNGDAKVDLLVDNWIQSSVSMLFGLGDGTFGPHIPVGVPSLGQFATAGDVNGDRTGSSDIVTDGNIAVNVLLNNAGTKITLTSSPNPAPLGTPVTLSAQVASSVTGQPQPTGPVKFVSGGTVLGTAELTGGVATFVLNDLPAGSTPIRAAYRGSALFNPHLSMPILQVVVAAGVDQ